MGRCLWWRLLPFSPSAIKGGCNERLEKMSKRSDNNSIR